MAPRGHPDEEIVGYDGRVGLGGWVSLRPVRAGDRYRRGRGCCLGTIALVLLGLVAAWALGHLVNRRAQGLSSTAPPAAPTRGRAVATRVASDRRLTATRPRGLPACAGTFGARSLSSQPAPGALAYGGGAS